VQDLILGLVAIAAGALFCFAGYLAFRLIIPLWGFFAGFAFGAGLISSITGDGFLRTLLGWAVGLGCALVFALLAYLFTRSPLSSPWARSGSRWGRASWWPCTSRGRG
jgi:hypothetical protein